MSAHLTLPEIVVITSYPPRECGLATYSKDLIAALNNKFGDSFNITVCALESQHEQHHYGDEVKYILNTDEPHAFHLMARNINKNRNVSVVMIQHEFGFFEKKKEEFIKLLNYLSKPIVVVFHTVLPNPNELLKLNVQTIAGFADALVVMTNSSQKILIRDYEIKAQKINVIAHGTHLVLHSDKEELKEKYQLSGRKVLSTFGLLSSGKSIETTLDALPAIVDEHPEVLFLIMGKTHPSVVKHEGEQYRIMLEEKVKALKLQYHVRFVNHFLPLPHLLEYLQLSDVYLFTSKDSNQAVSGTFSYALSCGCAIVSTPIPHALEVLKSDTGVIVDFENPLQLSVAVNDLLSDDIRRNNISSNALHKMAATAWENSALAHALLINKVIGPKTKLQYSLPVVNLTHIKKLTSDFAMIQFSKINQPDIDSGYTLDDNARAMVALCQQYELEKDNNLLIYIGRYLDFIEFCQQSDGFFLNYVDEEKQFTQQNYSTNLADSNGRAIWALGYLISLREILPTDMVLQADIVLSKALPIVKEMHSTRAIAFVIKGLYYRNTTHKTLENTIIIKTLADRLVQMYKHESDEEWLWFESYLTYANSILPEAMLCAYLSTNQFNYLDVARSSFDFLLSKIFTDDRIKVVSNKGWLHRGKETIAVVMGGEQPIDVAYSILALSKFNDMFYGEGYQEKMETSFNWFLGKNHLEQVMYNPCTGGCYDGLEENYVNLNQGAESTVSYLMARLTVEKSRRDEQKLIIDKENFFTLSGQKALVQKV